MMIKNANTILYHNPNIYQQNLLQPLTYKESFKFKPPNNPGTNIIACAKIIGITPEAFNFNGMYCLDP